MYPGGKNGEGTYHKIINKIPPHRTYIELFLGSGAILNNKKPAQDNYGVEIDAQVLHRFSYLDSAKIINQDVFTFVQDNPALFYPGTFVYLDPPYPLQSRKDKTGQYRHELTDLDHERLLTLVLSMNCSVAISTYENPLYSDLLSSWSLYKFQSTIRGGTATEFLYMNYPDPIRLHDYAHLGKDFIDRQRIKRKIAREISKLARMPTLERQAVLEGIKNFSAAVIDVFVYGIPGSDLP